MLSRPIVEEANTMAPAFARIFKEMIIVTDPSRPFPRAAKGTIQRKAAIQAYEAEIIKLSVSMISVASTKADEVLAMRQLRKAATYEASRYRSPGEKVTCLNGCPSTRHSSTTV